MTPQTTPTDRPLTAGDVELEDVLFFKLKDLILEQSEGEWDDSMIVRDAHHFASNLRPLFARPATSAASEVEGVDRVMAVLNHWFDGRMRVDRNSEMVAQLAALASPPVSERERELEGADYEAIDRSLRTIRAYDAVRLLQAALLDTMKRQHIGYDWNADPDQMTLKQGDALALATKVFADLSAAVAATDELFGEGWEEALTAQPQEPV